MAVTLTGVLKDPYGQPLPGATIRFDAVRTSATVLNHIRAEAITDAQGDYSISVEVGRYDVRVMQGRSFLELAKNLEVRADSTATDLNELVVEWQGEQDLTPGIVIEFRALVDEAREYRDEAASSADSASSDAEATAADRIQTGQDAQATAADRQQTGLDAQATAADRQQTGLNRQATSDDRQYMDGRVTYVNDQVDHIDSQRQAVDTAAGNAANSASAADGHANDAGDSALEAQHWAQYPNDTPVPEGDGSQFSAAHWAEVSRQRAVNAMVAQGAWDASTGSLPPEPTGASYWLVTGAANGETVGGVEYRNKDMLLWTPNESGGGGTWSKIDNTDSVASVAGKTGAVTLVPGDVGADPAGTAASAEQAAKDHADTKVSEAQAYAVQRSNHTGSQTLSTISDAGTAASRDVGTASNNLMEVGAFGLGVAEGWTVDSLNIDELKTAGIFSFSGSAGTPPPWFSGEGGAVVVSRHGGTFVTQVATAGGSGKMAVRVGNGTSFSWGKWRLIYTSNSIVSSVYDTGGIPGGGILEVGYNTNGSFLKLADGTLVCVFTGSRDITTDTASGSLFRSPFSITWTFPSAFHTVPYASFEFRKSGSLIWFVSDDTGSKVQMSMYAMSSHNGNYSGGFFRAFAVGRWK
ncbi:prophage tail fiber N-terminal domain-containing protein [Halomonas sp. DP1Y21-3]|uniref:prophage tail fiber N-terminal domain-containing protein n=1 Tax=Halomonas sp. DP1Y21-3 TaxID=2859080 RepID=UPI001C97828D|nr:prophage tail fiber N-terminal domain-containing protein [Halomonas sp. DP1Y21-3]MBY6111231.1 prophage tail fiber N-terminal domain-containing protein [Halomonas sp. DP1Y21-3]